MERFGSCVVLSQAGASQFVTRGPVQAHAAKKALPQLTIGHRTVHPRLRKRRLPLSCILKLSGVTDWFVFYICWARTARMKPNVQSDHQSTFQGGSEAIHIVWDSKTPLNLIHKGPPA